MNTDYSVGRLRLHFESRARRRRFVVLFYALLAVFYVSYIVQGMDWLGKHAPWFVCGLGILFVALMIVFSWLTDDMRTRGDERETHRREHAYSRAYRALAYFLLAALFASFFSGRNPITPLPSPAPQAFLKQLPQILLIATYILYFTLPQAVFLWTEPDMEVEQQAS